ncbi:hypothetical protein R69746_03063 [Paraburkholderia aspalathi]|nr:hypothetical protein R69746_03063 [Paraburkholderia aspalathi]
MFEGNLHRQSGYAWVRSPPDHDAGGAKWIAHLNVHGLTRCLRFSVFGDVYVSAGIKGVIGARHCSWILSRPCALHPMPKARALCRRRACQSVMMPFMDAQSAAKSLSGRPLTPPSRCNQPRRIPLKTRRPFAPVICAYPPDVIRCASRRISRPPTDRRSTRQLRSGGGARSHKTQAARRPI